jgi:hypothetical protein
MKIDNTNDRDWRRRTRWARYAVASLLAVLAVGATSQLALAGPAEPDVPSTIAVDEGHKLFLTAHAIGVQIYSCTATAAGPAWSFVAPRADLFGANGKLLGTHDAGPTWRARDGSFVVGRVLDRAPVAGSIPWLLLEDASTGVGEDGGRLAETAYIQRIATTGGLAPAGGCTSATVGAIAEVPYTADYTFWKRTGS